MKDYFGSELKVGDQVAYIQSGYRCFVRGVVKKITPKGIRIGNPDDDSMGEFRFGEDVIKKVQLP